MKRVLFLALLLVLLPLTQLSAQVWNKVLTLHGTTGSCAFFLNANEGFIGTGDYHARGMGTATILHTTDGGLSWTTCILPSPAIQGQVTDIYFSNPNDGWATIAERLATGWSGVYHSTDGGLSWKLVKQSLLPVGVRVTSRGVFFTENQSGAGVYFSSDRGVTWRQVASNDVSLGIDFIDDNNGFVTSQATPLGQHLLTTDGGQNWTTVPTHSECWSVFGDPISKSFILASERDLLSTATQTAILRSPVNTSGEVTLKQYEFYGLSGGVAGSKGCPTIVYVQGRKAGGTSPQGLIRSSDGGATWKAVGGPVNGPDTRFAVTGRGAVVIAFDSVGGAAGGGVWITRDGGDGNLSPSALPFVGLTATTNLVQAHVCDSAYARIALSYRSCDSVRIARVKFSNDTYNELSAPSYSNSYGFFSSKRGDTLRVLYRPTHTGPLTTTATVTIRQPDGYLEDTTITLNFIGLAPGPGALSFASTSQPGRIDFDSVSTCSDAEREVALVNRTCSDLQISSIYTGGGGFTVASSFKPFTLSAGNSRSFLLQFAPPAAGLQKNTLYVRHNAGMDSLDLTGIGFVTSRQMALDATPISAALCDSADFTFSIRNITCKPVTIDSVIFGRHFALVTPAGTNRLGSGERTVLQLRFKPDAPGATKDTIHLSLDFSGSGAYDTTIVLTATGLPGKPDVALSTQTLDLGDVSSCTVATGYFLVSSAGCGDVSLTGSVDNTGEGFSVMQMPSTVTQGSTDTIFILFQPQHLNASSATLTLNTSAGPKTVLLKANVVADQGKIAYSVTPNISSYTCSSTNFTVSFRNTGCDSITVLSATPGGPAASDFSIPISTPLSLASNEQMTLAGSFTPTDTLQRLVQIALHIVRRDGSILDTTIDVSALGLPANPIPVTVGNVQVRTIAGQTGAFSVYALAKSVTKLSVLDFTLHVSTDLFTPVRIVPGAGAFGGASVKRFIASGDTLSVRLELPQEIDLQPGKLCDIQGEAFVAKDLQTNVYVTRVGFDDAFNVTKCLSAVPTTADSVTAMQLDAQCGDRILSNYLATNAIGITSVTPNPTGGRVVVQFMVSPTYANDGELQVFDELGNALLTRPVVFDRAIGADRTATSHAMEIDLGNQSGVRYVRLQSPSHVETRRVLVTR